MLNVLKQVEIKKKVDIVQPIIECVTSLLVEMGGIMCTEF